jgi:hypothetical protein
MTKVERISVAFGLLMAAVAIFTTSWLFVACTPRQQVKFYDAANLVCDGLEEFQHLHDVVLSIHMLIQSKQFDEALKLSYTTLQSYSEFKEVEGLKELRALIFLLESLKGNPV